MARLAPGQYGDDGKLKDNPKYVEPSKPDPKPDNNSDNKKSGGSSGGGSKSTAVSRPREGGGTIIITSSGKVTERDASGNLVSRRTIDRSTARDIIKSGTSPDTRSKITRDGRIVSITEQDRLNDKEVIDRNKELLQDIEDKKAYSESIGNQARVQQLQRQYNDIARQSNQAIASENQRIEKAEIVSEFANLYPADKADKIVEESGMREYLIKDEAPSKVDKAPGSSMRNPDVLGANERWEYDSKTGLWVDKEASGSGANINYMNAKDFKDSDGLYWFTEPAKEETFIQKSRRDMTEVEWRLSNLRSDLLEKSNKATYSNNAYAAPLGLLYAGGSFVAGGVEGFVSLTKPKQVVEGFAETIANPVGTLRNVGGEFKKDPFGTVGFFAGQAKAFNVAGKVGSKINNKVQQIRSARAFERGRSYESGYNFNSQESMLYGQGQLYPKPRAEVVGDVRASSKSVLRRDTLDPSSVPEPVRRYLDDGQTNLRDTVRQRSKVETTSGDYFEVVDDNLPVSAAKQAAARARLASEARKNKVGDSQLELQGTRKPRAEDFYIEVVGDSGKKFIYYDKTPVFSSLAPGADLVAVEVSKLFDRAIQRRRTSKVEAAYKERSSIVKDEPLRPAFEPPSTKSTPVIAPPGVEDSIKASESSFSQGRSTIPTREDILSNPTRYRSVDRIDERYRIREDSKIDNKSRIAVDTASAVDSSQDVSQIQIQDPVVTPKPDYKPPRPRDPIQTVRTPPTREEFLLTTRAPKPPSVRNVRRGTGFNVFARVKGEFQKINRQGVLSRKDALNLGSFSVGSSSAATFKIEKADKPVNAVFKRKGNMRDFYRKDNLYIEKVSKRIDSPGEKKEITRKGLFALKMKNKLFGGRM